MARKRTRKSKYELVFTSDVEKVPSLNKRYARKFNNVQEHKPVNKSQSAIDKLKSLFK